MYGSILDANPFGCGSSKKPLVSLTDESDTLARLGFVAVGTPVLSLGSVGSVAVSYTHLRAHERLSTSD